MTIDELNRLTENGSVDEFIRVCEARQVKALSQIADRICAREGVRAVLLAGGSSAGKTTTAKRLCTQLRVNGREAMHLSTDDYFVGDRRNPRDENGELDYETIECVDRVRLAEDLQALFAGEAVNLRRFDFARHDGYDAPVPSRLPAGGIVVIEGLHALNPLLSEKFPAVERFGLFIEPVSQPVVFALTGINPTDARLLRRLVRDNSFRKMDPLETFRMWPKVLAGEKQWIDPYRKLADAVFDSALPYELAVLKPYAEGLLAKVLLKRPDEPKAVMWRSILEMVVATDPTKVPGDSILRETIGGSQLDY